MPGPGVVTMGLARLIGTGGAPGRPRAGKRAAILLVSALILAGWATQSASRAVLADGSAYASAVQADAPVAWWRFAETSASQPAVDSSGNGHTGTYAGGVTPGLSGPMAGDTAASFNGSTGEVQVPGSPALDLNGAFSIEFWAHLNSPVVTSNPPWPALLSQGTNGGGAAGYLIWYDAQGALHLKRNGVGVVSAPGVLTSTTAFHYYVVTYDGSVVRWYVDAALSSSTAESYPSNTSTSALLFGKGDSWGNDQIAEPAFYATALSPTQIGNHYQAGGGTATAPGAPTAVTAVAGDGQATVGWTAGPTGGSPITAFTVTPSPSGPAVQVVGTASSATVTGLTDGQAYTFTVTATNAVGTSPPSSPSNPVTPQTNSGSSYATTVLGDAPLGWWRFAETSTSQPALDSSGNGHAGAYTGGVTPGLAGPMAGDTAASFNGSTGQVQVPGSPALDLNGAFSIEFWAELNNPVVTSNPPWPALLSQGTNGAGANGYLIWYDAQGALHLKRNGVSVQSAAGALTSTSAFHYYAVTYDGSTVRWYVDGVLSSSKAESYPSNTSTAPLLFGKGDSWGNDKIAEPALYPIALTPTQIGNHYQAGGGTAVAPGPPTAVTAAAGDGQATVSWTAGSTGGSAITSFTVTASPGGATVQAAGTASSATVTGLTDGQPYTFTVSATNAVGTSPASSPSNSVTPQTSGGTATAPGAPTGVSAVAGDGQATVGWTPGSSGGSPITSFTVTASPGGTTVQVGGTASSATVTGLTDGQAYTFTVTATNAVGSSSPSSPSNSVTPQPNSQSPYATAVLGDAPVAWWRFAETSTSQPAVDSSGNGHTGTYSGGVSPGLAGPMPADTAASFNGSTGQVQVPGSSALDLNGAFSIEFWAKLNTPVPTSNPPWPGLLSEGNNGSGANGYLVWYDAQGALHLKRNGVTVLSAAGALTSASAFNYYVVTYDGSTVRWFVDGVLSSSTAETYPSNTSTAALLFGQGDSAGNDQIAEPALYATALTQDQISNHYQAGGGRAVAPGIPTGVTAVAGDGQATVGWTAGSTGGSPITSFTVTASPGGAAVQVAGTASSATVTGLTDGQAYTFTVSATNAIGTSPPSSPSNPVTPEQMTASDPVIAAAGDTSCLASSQYYNGSNPSYCQMRATASLISAMSPSPTAVLSLGDSQRYSATPPPMSDWLNSWAQPGNWGSLPYPIYPSTGNDDYGEDTNNGGAPGETAPAYFGYFDGESISRPNANPTGDTVNGQPAGWYSVNLGSWHLIALNTDCNAIGGCAAGNPQEAWLAQDLAANAQSNPNSCVLAFWEEPLYSDGSAGNESQYQPLWQDLYAYRADVVLNSHDHVYERYKPQDPFGKLSSVGITEFDVGTGGQSMQSTGRSANTAAAISNDFGVLEMTLHPDSFSWQWVDTGGAVRDLGTSGCNPKAAPAVATAARNGRTTASPATTTRLTDEKGHTSTVTSSDAYGISPAWSPSISVTRRRTAGRGTGPRRRRGPGSERRWTPRRFDDS